VVLGAVMRAKAMRAARSITPAPKQSSRGRPAADLRAAFVNRYIETGFANATQAAIDVGYSPRSAKVTACRILQRPEVVLELAQRKAAIDKKVEKKAIITRDRVLRELALLGTSSVEHYDVPESGKVVLQNGAPRGAMRAVSSVRVRRRIVQMGEGTVESVETEFKLWNKNNALEQIREMEGFDVPSPTAKGAQAGAVIELHGGPMGFELRVGAGAAVRTGTD
jgi:phage terminase small subunit